MEIDALKRLFDEFVELEDRLVKLRQYVNNAELDAECVKMLNVQSKYMVTYLIILRDCINYEMKSCCASFA